MSQDRSWQRYWRFLTARFRRDVDEELEFHIAMRARELEGQGLSAEAARREAERRFGDRTEVRLRLERIEKRRGLRMTIGFHLQELLQDLRYGIRSLRKRPAFTLMTASSLALGLAATTSVLSLVDSWLLRPLPGAHGRELIVIGASNQATGSMIARMVSLPTLRDVAARSDLFVDVAAERVEGAATRRSATDLAEPRIYLGVTGNYFSVVGIGAAAGRLFDAEDDRQRQRVLVLTHRAWTERYGADSSLIGSQLYLNTVPYLVVGVAQKGFAGTEHVIVPDGFVPVGGVAGFNPSAGGLDQARGDGWFGLFARPRPGISLPQVQSGLDLLSQQLTAGYPELGDGYRLEAVPETRARPSLESARGTTAGAVAFSLLAFLVLLTAIVNATNLILAQGSTRRGEMAVRQALGASRGRMVRQLVTETLLVSLLALAGGWFLARAAIAGLSSIPIDVMGTPLEWGISIDGRVFLMALGITLLVGLVAGVGPALVASRGQLEQRLREGGRAGGGRRAHRARGALVVAQVAASLIVLVSAGLFVASVDRAASVDLGFDPERVLALRLDANLAHQDEAAARAAFDRIERAVRDLPGVEAVAWSTAVPIEHGSDGMLEARTDATSQANRAGSLSIMSAAVGPGYFEVLGMPVVEGRSFALADDSAAPRVAIVNRRAAELLFPGRSPIGQTLRFSLDGPPVEVVGLTETSRYLLIGEAPRPMIYLPVAQQFRTLIYLVVRTTGSPGLAMEPVRSAIVSVDRDLAPVRISPLADIIETSVNGMLSLRVAATAVSVIGLLAMALTLVGLYGIIAYSVSERTREIGLRMALGASSWSVTRSVLAQGGRLALFGIGLGLLGALLVTGVFGGLLVDVNARDPLIFGSVALGLAAVALGSSYLPARRASRIDPVKAIKADG